MTKVVCQNCNPVDSSTIFKMLLNFLWQTSVVNLKQGGNIVYLITAVVRFVGNNSSSYVANINLILFYMIFKISTCLQKNQMWIQ
jgi:hypothetical protein